MREIFTSGSVRGLVEQSLSLPGQSSGGCVQRCGWSTCRRRLIRNVRSRAYQSLHWRTANVNAFLTRALGVTRRHTRRSRRTQHMGQYVQCKKRWKRWTQENGLANFDSRNGHIGGPPRTVSDVSYLCTVGEFSDFELELDGYLDLRFGKDFASAVQIRSHASTEGR